MIYALSAFSHPKVEYWKHIWPTESEHQEHLRGPWSNTSHLHQCLNDRFIIKRFNNIERQPSINDMPREVSNGRSFCR